MCVCVCPSVHWLCAIDDHDQTGGVIARCLFGRVTDWTWHAKPWSDDWVADCQLWPCEVMARCCHGMMTFWYPWQPFSFLWWLVRKPGMTRESPHLPHVELEANQYFTVLFITRSPHWLTWWKEKLIPKTIGNRKRDCAWGGSRW